MIHIIEAELEARAERLRRFNRLSHTMRLAVARALLTLDEAEVKDAYNRTS